MGQRAGMASTFWIAFNAFGIVIGGLCLALLAADGRLWTNPFRGDFWNGPGLGLLLVLSGSVDLVRGIRGRRAAAIVSTDDT